jgi:hypothetical protein
MGIPCDGHHRNVSKMVCEALATMCTLTGVYAAMYITTSFLWSVQAAHFHLYSSTLGPSLSKARRKGKRSTGLSMAGGRSVRHARQAVFWSLQIMCGTSSQAAGNRTTAPARSWSASWGFSTRHFPMMPVVSWNLPGMSPSNPVYSDLTTSIFVTILRPSLELAAIHPRPLPARLGQQTTDRFRESCLHRVQMPLQPCTSNP